MAGQDSDHHPDQDSRLDFSIENEMNQLSPLVSLVSPLVSGPASCVPPYKASQEVACPGPGPAASSILVRETPASLSQEVSCDDREQEEQEEQKQEPEQEQEVKKDLLSPPSVASSLVCLQAQRRSSLSLAEQKFKSM